MSTDLATVETRGLSLQTFAEAMQFAKVVSATDFAPKDFRGKPEACMLAIQYGAELGLKPMQALQNIAVINGRPSIWGDAALALVHGSPVCEWVYETVDGEGDSMGAMCQAKRRGCDKPSVSVFTVADAKKAGLWGKSGPWQQYPRRMLQLRARGFALRDAFPDVLRGLITAEEARDYQVVDPESRPQPEVRTRMEPQPHAPAGLPAPAGVGDAVAEKARLAINNATTMGTLQHLAAAVAKRGEEGKLTADEVLELVTLAETKMELLSAGTAVRLEEAALDASSPEAITRVRDEIDLALAEGRITPGDATRIKGLIAKSGGAA